MAKTGIKKTWEGGSQKAHILAELGRRIAACVRIVANHAKRLVSVAGTGTGRSKSSGKFKKVYGANPSAPGEPPRKQTGRLMQSIATEVSGLVGRVGTNLNYGRWLELGTRKMAARPWLRRALKECAEQIRAVLSRPIN